MHDQGAPGKDQGAPEEVIDLTESAGEEEAVASQPGTKRRRLSVAAEEGSITNEGKAPAAGSAQPVEYLSLPGGVLDDKVLQKFDAIVQQLNCVGCDGRGLAEGVKRKLPYGCSYASRQRMPPQNKFAVEGDRATLGQHGILCEEGTIARRKRSAQT